MPKLSQIKGAVRRIPIDFAGVKLTFAYYPARVNSDLDKQITASLKAAQEKLARGEELSDEDAEFTAQRLIAIVDQADPWDLVDDDSEPCPFTIPFLINEIGYYGLAKMMAAVTADRDPN